MVPEANAPVTTIASWPVATVSRDDDLASVAEALAADEVGAVLVTHRGRLLGVVSERDVVRHVVAGAPAVGLVAGEVMSVNVVSVATGTSILDAALLMVEADVRHLPVLDDEERLAGVVSMRDALAALSRVIAEEYVVVVPSGTRVVVHD